MFMFRTVVVNGVRLVVYPDGTILRYSEKTKGRLPKGWSIIQGSINTEGYKTVTINSNHFKQHRIVSSAFLGLEINDPKQIIDHIDRDKCNNNVNNLRIVSNEQNALNRTHKGYTWNKFHQKYLSRIMINHKNIHLGYFETKEEALQAYLDAKKIHHIIE